MSFSQFNLHPDILKAIAEAGITTPTPIQSQAIPQVLNGVDLQASAKTGTGKTATFLLPLLHKLTTPATLKGPGPRALILVPTRELAMQVAAEASKYSKHLNQVKTVCLYGGVPYPKQNKDLSRPYEILVATPGRLIDQIERGRVKFGRLEMFILDEADRMLDMGFIEPVEKIAALTPKTRQTLMFSATLKGAILGLSKRLLKDPLEIKVASDSAAHENIDQKLYPVDDLQHKYRLLSHFLTDPALKQVILFSSTKHQADALVDRLVDEGHMAEALHGDMKQSRRSRTIAQLRRGAIRVLVATDVAARGIDVLTISHVINFDLPRNAEDYVHRIGRTGRAGGKGIALSFVSSKDMPLAKRIEQFTGHKMEFSTVQGLEPKFRHSIDSRPPPQKRGFNPHGRKPNRPFGGFNRKKPHRFENKRRSAP